jgi:hypothetical protein
MLAADFDSAIRRFDPSRPSQIQRADFVKKIAFPEPKFLAHLEIQFAPHLEILCWFRLVKGRWKTSRAERPPTHQNTN